MTARIPLSVPDLRGREREFLTRCVDENWVSSAGPQVTEFEHALAGYAGRAHAVALASGTAALHLALLAAGVAGGDQVIVPDWTFAASANAVAHAGATAYFVDVSDTDWGLDPELVDDVLAREKGVKAVIAVDPLGHAANMQALMDVCRRRNMPLIEDAAGAIGATHGGRACGSFGTVSVFSFNGNKTLTTGGGGMALTDDDAIARVIRHRSTQARPGPEYVHDAVGFNYRMSNLAAAVGLAQFERLDEMVAAKRAIAARYDAAFAGRNDIAVMPRPSHSNSSCWLYSVRLALEADARSLVAALAERGVEARIFWRSLSQQRPWSAAPRLLKGVSAALSGSVVSLPCSSSLKMAQQDRVLQAVTDWCGSDLSRA